MICDGVRMKYSCSGNSISRGGSGGRSNGESRGVGLVTDGVDGFEAIVGCTLDCGDCRACALGCCGCCCGCWGGCCCWECGVGSRKEGF